MPKRIYLLALLLGVVAQTHAEMAPEVPPPPKKPVAVRLPKPDCLVRVTDPSNGNSAILPCGSTVRDIPPPKVGLTPDGFPAWLYE